VKKVIWFPVMILAIPLDIIGWNVLFGWLFGFRTPRQCADENIKMWKEL